MRKNKLKSVSRNYSAIDPTVLEEEGRLAIARQIAKVLSLFLKKENIHSLKLLDIGCSSGVISNHLSKTFGKVIGIDVDSNAIVLACRNFRRKNLEFYVMDGARTSFPNSSFDVIVANQIYYCFRNPEKLFDEIFRLLKTGGICFLGGRNKYAIWDAPYRLPLLSFLPKKITNLLVKTVRSSEQFGLEYRTYWQLERMCRRFKVEKVTPKAIHNCRKYGFKKFEKFKFFFSLIPEPIWEIVEPFLPNFVWILEKPDVTDRIYAYG